MNTAAATDMKGKYKEKEEEILALIRERRSIQKEEKEKERIREVSKKIKNCIRDKKRTARQDELQKILEELRGTKNIPSIKSTKKRFLIPNKNMKGEIIT